MSNRTEIIRLKITDTADNVKYLSLFPNDKVSLKSKNNTPLALSFITDNAAELAFALQGSYNLNGAIEAVRKHIYSNMRVEVL